MWIRVEGPVIAIVGEDMLVVLDGDTGIIYLRWVGHDWSFVSGSQDTDVDIGDLIYFFTQDTEQYQYKSAVKGDS